VTTGHQTLAECLHGECMARVAKRAQENA
jgi:hypothetical protein